MGTPKGKIIVCRVEYETKDRTQWKATILAYGMQDAIDYLMKYVKDFDRYTSTQIIGPVDAIETKIVDDYFSSTKVVETVVKSVPDESTGDTQTICPWCEKEFKNKTTLGTHIKKFHLES